MNSPFPKTLIREIADRRVVFFVGSGVSKAARPTFPTWAGLLDDLSGDLPIGVDKKLVKKLIKQGRLLDAAQIVSDKLPIPDLHQKLRDTFLVQIENHHDLYSDIVALDPKIIVTTNYDELLEKGIEHFSDGQEAFSVIQHTEKNALNYIRSPMRSVMKFHGTIQDVPNVVLTRRSYFNAKKDNPGFYGLMSSLMTVNTVIFFGYGLSDPDIQLILENIHSQHSTQHPHYVISPKMESRSLRSAFEDTYNLSIIEYPADDHGKMLELLSQLRIEVDALRQSRGIV